MNDLIEAADHLKNIVESLNVFGGWSGPAWEHAKKRLDAYEKAKKETTDAER